MCVVVCHEITGHMKLQVSWNYRSHTHTWGPPTGFIHMGFMLVAFCISPGTLVAHSCAAAARECSPRQKGPVFDWVWSQTTEWICLLRARSMRCKLQEGAVPHPVMLPPSVQIDINPRCNEETRTIKAVSIFVWNFDPISWKNYQIWSNFRQTEN